MPRLAFFVALVLVGAACSDSADTTTTRAVPEATTATSQPPATTQPQATTEAAATTTVEVAPTTTPAGPSEEQRRRRRRWRHSHRRGALQREDRGSAGLGLVFLVPFTRRRGKPVRPNACRDICGCGGSSRWDVRR